MPVLLLPWLRGWGRHVDTAEPFQKKTSVSNRGNCEQIPRDHLPEKSRQRYRRAGILWLRDGDDPTDRYFKKCGDRGKPFLCGDRGRGNREYQKEMDNVGWKYAILIEEDDGATTLPYPCDVYYHRVLGVLVWVTRASASSGVSWRVYSCPSCCIELSTFGGLEATTTVSQHN